MLGTNNANNKDYKIFNPSVQKNMKISGVSNPEIIQGLKTGNSDYTTTDCNEFINIDLLDEYYVKGIKLTFWHFNNRFYTYECWVSKDYINWNELFSGYQAKCNDTIIIMDTIRYIRLKGKNNENNYLHLVNFKII